ncbi:type II restriction endonuclease [Thermovenabulum gondwanense]|uniref:Type-2 restriction enzyme n=1 Tax=Thermovenabulum gondwanense TaxID=520767 RepID=A0A162MES7_9FIRM|nr:type II restriction endonuclease [Thermovenabulum gondwanense]KYO65503.1 Type-2 restriction enzyme DpnII [Thermovenabulum gondwanense]
MNKLYLDFLNLNDQESVIEKFHETIIDTNRSYDFFTDWSKIKKHINKFKIELNIFNSLIWSKEFEKDLKKILKDYPQVIPVIPLLLAIREKNLKIIKDLNSGDFCIVNYDFNARTLSDKEIEDLVEFFNKTGLKKFFLEMGAKSIQDYAIGVEVGLDTHARKNRSGRAMEILLKPIIENISNKLGYKPLFQKKFGYLEDKYKIRVNPSIKNRKADFILIKNNKIINIEVNFFSGTGSKPQEIVDSYIERQNELKENGFKFIWITDGEGWKGQKNQIHKGFDKIDYLLNIHFVRLGLLEEIICRI